jgi:uncharacterized protein GlcG (DUF336 family)
MPIRLAEANRAIQAALAKAHNLAVNISVTVCDADGRLVALQRMDGALAEANLASIGKALASARSGRPSGDESIEGSEYFRAATVIGEGAPLIRRPGSIGHGGYDPVITMTLRAKKQIRNPSHHFTNAESAHRCLPPLTMCDTSRRQ